MTTTPDVSWLPKQLRQMALMLLTVICLMVAVVYAVEVLTVWVEGKAEAKAAQKIQPISSGIDDIKAQLSTLHSKVDKLSLESVRQGTLLRAHVGAKDPKDDDHPQ